VSDSHRLKLMLEEIDRSPELTLFFTKLTERDSTFAKIFLLHQDELLPGDRSIKLPYLFWNNFPTEKATSEKYRIVETLVKLEEIKSEQALKALPGFLKLAEEGMSEEMKDLLVYAAITVARQNEGIRKLIVSKDFSFRFMKETLRDYRDLHLDFPKKLPNADEHIIRQKAMHMVTPMIEDMRTGRLVGFLEKLPYLAPDILMVFHVREADQHLIKMLKASEIEKDLYMEAITELFSLGLIWNVHTVFWCENCRDQLQLLRTTSQFSPHHLKIPCPRCKKPMSVSSIFRIHDLLQQCIVSQDGLLAVALAWLLKKNDVKYEVSVYNEHEYDFICITPTGDMLVECKMHRRPGNERSVRGALEKDLKQATEHFETLKKKTSVLKKGYVIYNYDLEEYLAIINDVSKKCENIKVIEYQDLSDLVQLMKSTQPLDGI